MAKLLNDWTLKMRSEKLELHIFKVYEYVIRIKRVEKFKNGMKKCKCSMYKNVILKNDFN